MHGPVDASAQRVLELRVVGASDRLHAACNSTDAAVVNAAIGDWLDAVYAAQEPYWRGARSVVEACREEDVAGARVVGALVHARGRSTHEWAVLSTFEDLVDRYYRPHYGAWCWTAWTPSEDELARFYVDRLAGRLVTDSFDPAVEFVTRTLPARCL